METFEYTAELSLTNDAWNELEHNTLVERLTQKPGSEKHGCGKQTEHDKTKTKPDIKKTTTLRCYTDPNPTLYLMTLEF